MADPYLAQRGSSSSDPYLQPRATATKPTVSKAFFVPRPAPVNPTPANTAQAVVVPGHGESKRFYQPLSPGQKPAGYEAVGGRKGRAGIGSPVTSRPYWLATRGPVGDAGAVLNAADVAKAASAGVRPTVAGQLLASTLHPLTNLGAMARGEKPADLGSITSDVANIAANFVPVGKAAGILGGLRGLKVLRGAKVAADAGEAAKTVGPLPGFTRLYRGEGPHGVGGSPASGSWFTDNPKHAQHYADLNTPGLSGPRTTIAGRPTDQFGRPFDVSNPPPSGRVYYVDVPHEVATKARVKFNMEDQIRTGNGEYQLPREFASQMKLHPPGAVAGADVAKAASAGVRPTVAKALRDAKAGAKALDTAKGAEAGAEAVASSTPQQTVRGALKGARTVRGKQEVGYSAERSKRVAAATVHLDNQALAPEERLALAKNELKGELPKINYKGMTVLDDHALAQLQTDILDHPHLMPFQKITASTALANAVAGKVPTKSELTLLEHVFGKDTASGLGQIHNHNLKDTILSVLNVPRSLMASFDLSAPFRQGLVVGTRHPSIFFKNFKPMVKAFGSEKVYQAIHTDIRARPTYPMMMEAKLSLTDLGHDLGAREEQFASGTAEKIPLVGHGVRASGRAYVGFLDKTRADVFDHLIGQAQAQGLNVQDTDFLRSLGKYINSATGRGDLGHFQEAGKVLNTFLFSPRLLASRLNFLNPAYYARLDPFARKEALRSAIQLAGTLSTLLTLASRVPGVKVTTDPRNPDWGKIRVGNTRIDIAGGFQQPLRLFAQLATGEAISSTTGKRLSLTAGGFGQPNRLDLFLRFFEGKESPIASFVTDYMRNSNQVGTPFKWTPEISSRMIPLLAQDAYDLYNQHHGGMNGLAAAFGGYALGSVGLGMQTYGAKPTKAPAPFSSSGSDPYLAPRSSSGGGSLYLGGR